MLDNYSSLTNSILDYIVKRPGVTDCFALYNGWSKQDKRAFGYDRTERATHAVKIITVLAAHPQKDLNTLWEIEQRDGTLFDYSEVSN
jgi:hypothetical protein